MRIKLIIISLLLNLTILPSQPRALIFGIKYSNDTPAISIVQNSTDNNGRFGLLLGAQEKNHAMLIGIGYTRHKYQSQASYYARRLTLSLEYRYQLFPADKASAMNIMPYGSVAYFKSFSKVTADSAAISPSDVEFYRDLSNDKGGWVAIGAEYLMAPVFSIGCEGGIRYISANSDAYGYETKITEYKTYIALLMTFRL